MDYVDQIKSLILEKMKTHRKFLDEAIGSLSEGERAEFNEYCKFCVGQDLSLDYLADCYCTIVSDTLMEQIRFQRHGKYSNTSFAEVEKAVYGNAEYMDKYMYGLALTAFLWPNHRALHDFFDVSLPKDRPGRYLEVGPGHGYFFLKAMRHSSYDTFEALDVSKTSVEQTKSIVGHFEPEKARQVQYRREDFITSNDLSPGYDAIVMGEVLEHIEDPQLFMNRLYELVRPGGFVFMTTCCNSPAIDHISLFDNAQQVDDICTAAGFEISDKLYVPYLGKTLEEAEAARLAVNVGYNLVRPA